MTPILVSGSSARLSTGLAAALAAESAALTSGATLLAEVGAGAQRRRVTLFVAPAARELEEALRAAGLRASATSRRRRSWC